MRLLIAEDETSLAKALCVILEKMDIRWTPWRMVLPHWIISGR